jgi:hypothetical protein
MTHGTPSPSSNSPNWNVTYVDLYVDHSVVYKNDRQQAQIRVYIEAKDGNTLVKLTESEKRTVRLIDYQNPTQELPFSDGGSTARYRGWSAQRTWREYDPYPQATSTGAPATGWTLTRLIKRLFRFVFAPQSRVDRSSPRAGGDYLTFYVSASAEALTGAPLFLAFIVTGDNGNVYRTDGYVTKNGSTGYVPNIDTGVEHRVDAKTPQRLPIITSRSPLSPARAGIFDDVIALTVDAGGGQPLNVHEMTCQPAGMIHWPDNLPDTRNPCYLGYARPGTTTIEWNADVPTGSQPRPSLSRPLEKKGALILCGRVDIPRTVMPNPPLGPIRMSLVDGYGTTQEYTVSFNETERDELTIV